jgi:hypothetical protein
MSIFSKQLLFWTPRVLSIAFIAFLSLFALDVFAENLGFWQTALALFMHLIPSMVLIAALVFAWRWEWIGAALFGVIAFPAFLIAGLFLTNWFKHDELRNLKQ